MSRDKSLWVDRHQPTSVKELCIAPKKIKEVQTYITQYPCSSKLMILVGSPGTGKSTLVQVLAKYEFHYDVLQWSESHCQDGQSPLKSFEEFLSQAGVFGHSNLMFQNTAREGDIDILGLNDGLAPSISSKRKGRQVNGRKSKIQRGRDSYIYPEAKKGSLILIDEIPNLYTTSAATQFRQTLATHIKKSSIPTILVFSNVSEGKHKPEDLERLVEPAILYSPAVQMVQINAVTKAKMRSILGRIIQLERGRVVSNNVYDECHALSGGDLRHAIMSLQFQLGANISLQTSKSDVEERKRQYERDTRLSAFHALGKILYAKRQSTDNNVAHFQGGAAIDGRPPLQFVPEKVMEESDMELSGSLHFLVYNSPDFFSSISDLSTALDDFSDAALLLEKKYDGSFDLNYPLGYVASLAGRAIADANKNPTPNKFRQLNPPGIFEVMKKKREMDVNLSLIRNRLSRSCFLSMNTIIGSSELFASIEFPMINKILPNETGHALRNALSHTQDDTAYDSSKQCLVMLDWKSQMEILANDDIIDDSSSDSNSAHVNINDNHLMASTKLKASMKSSHQHIANPSSSYPEIVIID